MSWLYSRALVEEYLVENSLDGEPFVQLNVMLTPQPFLRNDKTMDCSRPSLFGLTCALLTESRGKELLMLYLGAFHAKTLVSLEGVLVSTGSDQDYGKSLQGLLATYDRDSHSLKTAQHSLFADLIPFSVILPSSGIMQNGRVYHLPRLELSICETEYGLLPTPCAQMGGYNKSDSKNAKIRPSLEMMARHGLWPKMYPTPVATDGKGAPAIESVKRRELESKRGVRLEEHLARSGEIGQLNPTWVEWLMGWPLGWTDLKPLVMDKCQNVPQKLGNY